jgi:catechol 2,3-dioxygenase-like lactoylglutathione lyase family enzyme
VISHVSLGVADLARSRAFYDALLAPLGYVAVWSSDRGIGYGLPGGPDKLALFLQDHDQPLAAGPGSHLALWAPDETAVQGSHRAALASGGSNEGSPGLRPRYGPAYYAAFIRDPDGHKLELKARVVRGPRPAPGPGDD